MAGTRRVHPDVVFENHGTIFRFWCNVEAAQWAVDNVQLPDYMWMGPNNFACEHRYADQLVAGFEEAGFTVREG